MSVVNVNERSCSLTSLLLKIVLKTHTSWRGKSYQLQWTHHEANVVNRTWLPGRPVGLWICVRVTVQKERRDTTNMTIGFSSVHSDCCLLLFFPLRFPPPDLLACPLHFHFRLRGLLIFSSSRMTSSWDSSWFSSHFPFFSTTVFLFSQIFLCYIVLPHIFINNLCGVSAKPPRIFQYVIFISFFFALMFLSFYFDFVCVLDCFNSRLLSFPDPSLIPSASILFPPPILC